MNKAVVFDLDGTLIDSLPDIAEYVNLTLKSFGEKEIPYEDIRKYIGNGAKNLVKRSFGNKLSEEDLAVRLKFYNEKYTASGSPKTKLFVGIKELLFSLKEKGYKLGILTNKPQETTEGVYETYLSEFGFDKVVGARSGVKIKPDPSALYEILDELGVKPENAYFIGDGETDVQTAINAGANGVSVLWGYRDKDQLLDAGAKVFAKTPEELLNIICL